MDIDNLNDCLQRLIAAGALSASDWPANAGVSPERAGLQVVQRNGESLIVLPEQVDLLDATRVEAAMSERGGSWLDTLQVFPCTGSTSTHLMTLGEQHSVAGHLCLAEFQASGRGRRGRGWISPFARNLAMSFGVSLDLPLARLGGLSTVVGLALVEQLRGLGATGVQLKWPNDVWFEDRKLCGILVELIQRERRVEAVIGIGVNVALAPSDRSAIDQPAADLRELGITSTRSELVGSLVSAVVEQIFSFEQHGFAPFVSRFNRLHRFHQQSCRVVIGPREVNGVVVGITEGGELLLQTDAGVSTFNAGEVSLRGE